MIEIISLLDIDSSYSSLYWHLQLDECTDRRLTIEPIDTVFT